MTKSKTRFTRENLVTIWYFSHAKPICRPRALGVWLQKHTITAHVHYVPGPHAWSRSSFWCIHVAYLIAHIEIRLEFTRSNL